VTTQEKVEAYLQRAELRAHLKAFTYVDAQGALQSAAESDERSSEGLARPLEGLVVAVKDNINVKGLPLTCASNILKDFHPVFDATVVEKLRDAGAVIIGKTNMDEFAMGSSNEHSAFGAVKHPLDETRVPGGSSGGSAVAVADGQCDVALGSDTGGSVRQPAAFCGVYGLKPTYGRVSRYGLVAFASSLDQIGIFSRSVDDAARVFDVITGHDPMDSTSHVDARGSAVAALAQAPSAFTFGTLPTSLLDGCDAEVRSAYDRFVESLRSIGGTPVEIDLPHSEIWIPTYFILATAEASSNLARFDGVRYGLRAEAPSQHDMMTATRSAGFGTEVKRRIMLGTYVLSSGYHDAYYTQALKARRLIAEGYAKAFESVDVIAMPATPTTAFKRGEITDPVQMWLSDLYTVSANIAGIPALTVPVGTDKAGLPIGMQLQGPMFKDELLMGLSQKL
jgi:aspartyl-tRNA(Asn)/glutamyl-tRNA(Gln) amidotransferase subunit A